MSDPFTPLPLNQLPLLVSMAGFAVQTLMEAVVSPVVTLVLPKPPANPPDQASQGASKETDARAVVLRLCSSFFGVIIAGMCHIRILASLLAAAGSQNQDLSPIVDALFSGLVIGAGTEGANSLLKFIQYAKDAKAADAAQINKPLPSPPPALPPGGSAGATPDPTKP